ncbi:Chaperone protein HscA [Candidatus Entotheonellaceae bacterium PAL068K]
METPSRYVIGIDLGTTKSAVAYIDTQDLTDGDVPSIHLFNVLQLVADRECEPRPTLPSFLYFISEPESQAGALRLPWDQAPAFVVGVLARERGALVPGRFVSSAKSWLCHGEVDRTANILPWGSEATEQTCSPVEASARYLAHIRQAWNHTLATDSARRAACCFEQQEIILTVPASFDQEARGLTVQAARDAGIEHLTLIEEPQAAFYAWSVAHHQILKRELSDGHVVLICDVGGGTTDLSLIRIQITDGHVRIERTAIGEHLLLGGDNVDLALAHRLEAKLGHPQLTLRQRQALWRQSCAAKERLLSDPDLERVSIQILGSGSAVIGGALSATLRHDEVVETLLDGFLPLAAPNAVPRRARRTGLRELGLPYASEPAITKHLAQFLLECAPAGQTQGSTPGGARRESALQMVRPDAILFNGGFFTPAIARERVVDVIAAWFRQPSGSWRPHVLDNDIPETAVAVGAAYYGQVQRAGGLRIHGGSARAYYIGVQTDAPPANQQVQAVCIMPRGTEEGTRLALSDRAFTVLTNRPASFTLYSSTTRPDAHGEVVGLMEAEVHRHAPLITVLRYGRRRSQQVELAVQLSAHFTEVGTLELWCQSQKTEHRWRLQFQLRGAAPRVATAEPAAEATQTIIPDTSLRAAELLIRAVFGRPEDQVEAEPVTPQELAGKLEARLGYGRDAWPMVSIRKLADLLLQVAAGREKSALLEARWLNLFGFCLRPGFGDGLDTWRIQQTRPIYHAGLTFAKNLDVQVQWLILWRRTAGGLNRGQQHELYERHLGLLGASGKKRSKRRNRQLEDESWRLLASLERLATPERVALGQVLLSKLIQHPRNKSYVWSLGRLGARIPFAGPINCVIPAATAAEWLHVLLHLPDLTPDVAAAIVQLGARTDDLARDISDDLRQLAIRQLRAANIPDDVMQSLHEYVPPARTDTSRIFGESLPAGLRLVDAAG